MAPEHELIHMTWLKSDRTVPRQFLRPVLQYTRTEAAGGIILGIATVIAVLWANSPWFESYFDLFNFHISLDLGLVSIDESVKHLINNGLMSVFFFVVGLEIKRELVIGELNSVKKAALPIMAAVGGMMVPAAIFATTAVLGGASHAAHGWGIPMATDIAFSLGIIALLGTRVPIGAKLFFLALVITDDLGAILVIAFFYTDQLNLWYLLGGLGGIVGIYLARRAGIWSLLFYVPIAFIVWELFLESGVHATIAGVVIGLLTPVRPKYSHDEFREKAGQVLNRWDANRTSPDGEDKLNHDALVLAAVAKASVSPVERLEQALHPWSSFVVVPLFALANAGVRFIGKEESLVQQLLSPVGVAVAIALVVGKPIGITLTTWLGVRLNLGELPTGTTMRSVIGLGTLAGIGFTLALFIADLAFTDPILTDEAKLGIFLGSTIAAVVGYMVLRTLHRDPDPVTSEMEDALIGPDG